MSSMKLKKAKIKFEKAYEDLDVRFSDAILKGNAGKLPP